MEERVDRTGGTPSVDQAFERADPITLSVLLNRFHAIAEQMSLAIERSAWSTVLALCRDFSCAIYDVAPRQVCMFDAIPIHTTSMHLVLREIARVFDGEVGDGDVFACNDPHRGNTHIGDLVIATPVFFEGRHVFWAVTRGHQHDTGAVSPSSVLGTARNVYQEGITIPPIRLVEAGRLRSDVVELYLANVRYRETLYGDLLAQMGSVAKGKEQLLMLCSEYGIDELLRYVDALIDYSARSMAYEISAIPDGEYHGESWIDADGAGNVTIPVRCRITVEHDSVTVDWSESGPQAEGATNGTLATTTAASGVPIMCIASPDLPHNQGSIDRIKVTAKPGTVCLAEHPAATSSSVLAPSGAMHDAVMKALAEAVPDRVAAGGPRMGNCPTFSGVDERTGEPWSLMFFNDGGGSGAARGADGWPLIGTLCCLGGIKTMSVEHLELLYPFRLETMEIEPESMGFGEWNGGPGVRAVVRPLHGEMTTITFGDGYDNPPHGVLGGTPGIGGGQWSEPAGDGPRTFGSACARLDVPRGGAWVGVATGGGGYGDPCARDPEQVRADARDGLISRRTARDTFGVVLGDGPELPIDAVATARLRAGRPAPVAPGITPTGPSGATWRAAQMRDGDSYLLNSV
ncbi:MAG: N-methylhydantoinase [Solirubrobacteraceae bacterium]|jgi:N-methylhydantoinase B|nr:N-methylhydantoinase [Solirubrobacteraceae bacterium]